MIECILDYILCFQNLCTCVCVIFIYLLPCRRKNLWCMMWKNRETIYNMFHGLKTMQWDSSCIQIILSSILVSQIYLLIMLFSDEWISETISFSIFCLFLLFIFHFSDHLFSFVTDWKAFAETWRQAWAQWNILWLLLRRRSGMEPLCCYLPKN